VPFRVSARTLERLEWPLLIDQLAERTRTPGGRVRCTESLFEATRGGVRDRLAETSEARQLLEAEEIPPLGGVHDLDDALARVAKGGTLSPEDLLQLRSTLCALRDTGRFLSGRAERAPHLAEHAAAISDTRNLQSAIERAIDSDGSVRDTASPVLAEARRDAHRLAAEAQTRIERSLRDPGVAAALSDSFFTVRGDRYVLPVRADARGRVPGIVHDASASGTTLYIEPQALVDLNNRHKQAELTIEREIRRVLRELSEHAARERAPIVAGLGALDEIDLAFARGRLSIDHDAAAPTVGEEGVLELPGLRHPLLLEEAVPNDLGVGRGYRVLVISGPNAGGKTVAMKSMALAVLMVRAGLHVPADDGARVDLFDRVLADIGDEQNLREHLSTFSAHMANLAAIVETAGPSSLVVLDEVGVGTDPGEGAALAQAALEVLADANARVVATTHYNLLKEMAEVDERFRNASVEFDPETLAPTYRVTMGAAGSSSALTVAARMGVPPSVLERAGGLLDREDRRLDRMLAELATSRASLEREREEAGRLRAESEARRDEYRKKLERLQERRDQLFEEMRGDLDRAFKEAHSEVAGVIRDLQRGGGDARRAAGAREKLLSLEESAREKQAEVGDRPEVPAHAPPRLDWNRVAPGDKVSLPGGRAGTVIALPDRRGRATVLVGTARMQLPADQIGPASGASGPVVPRPGERVQVERQPAPEVARRFGAREVDLRGLRVDECLDRLSEALEEAVSHGEKRVLAIHGLGTGALRSAVRDFLRQSKLVIRTTAAAREEGGDGATVAVLDEGL
jgi:DNA mismatch repair protein MutS2